MTPNPLLGLQCLFPTERMEQLLQEVSAYRLDILGMTEMRQKGQERLSNQDIQFSILIMTNSTLMG